MSTILPSYGKKLLLKTGNFIIKSGMCKRTSFFLMNLPDEQDQMTDVNITIISKRNIIDQSKLLKKSQIIVPN